ncbi:MAG TPA: methyltransferase [Thermoanaerobaculia bacterium]|jgi:SAM-dependent methyltransferase
MTRSARDFPLVSAALDDPAIRALFTERFLAATEIYDALVDAACWKVLGDVGARPAPGEEKDEEKILLSVPSRARVVVHYMIEKLVDAGFLLRRSGGAFAAGSASTPSDVAALAAELAAAEPDAAVGAEIVSLLADEGAAFLRGEKTGEEILFSPARLPLWIRYFSNANILYAINNTLGAEALTRALPASGAEVLEIGGGCGSAAEAALSRLGTRVARWRFTELVPTFARRGERAARAAAAPGTLVEAAKLDMTTPWAEQGVLPGTFDAVYSVNCFHVAPDLGFVLSEAKAALKRGGVVVVSECVKPGVHPPPSYVDFVFDFLASFTDVKTDPVLRPNHGFLSPAAWRASFAAAGFRGVEVLPDVDAVAARFPKFFVGALVARA